MVGKEFMEINEIYNKWVEFATEDIDLVNELKSIVNDKAKIEDAFYKELAFGTGGLRGVIGAGSNRLNIYTIRKASAGLANYISKKYYLPIKVAIAEITGIEYEIEFILQETRVILTRGFQIRYALMMDY